MFSKDPCLRIEGEEKYSRCVLKINSIYSIFKFFIFLFLYTLKLSKTKYVRLSSYCSVERDCTDEVVVHTGN